MKLSEYRNEDALDLLADIIEPASEIMTDGEFKNLISKPDVKKVELAKYLLKQHKTDIIAILARLNGEDVYDASIVDILKQVLDLMNDKELIDFFVSQAQMTEGESSTPAMEIIKGTEEA